MAEADGWAAPWRHWGPYLAERAWGTVREDYSAAGSAWNYFPFEHAHRRAFRWSEDGMAGMCDEGQTVCLALALWNGRDPILKERMYGLTGEQGNHGEDVKEYWWYLDATPTASYLRWRYHYPQGRFPYEELVAENRRRSRLDPEYELVETGIFADDRFWAVEVEWAKADPQDLLWRIRVRNAGPEEATIDVLPTIWFRNLWSWGVDLNKPEIRVASTSPDGVTLVAEQHRLGKRVLYAAGPGPDLIEPLFCDNESNAAGLWQTKESPAFPKDAIGDHVINGAASVNPAQRGTKAALRYHLTVPAGGEVELRLRFSPAPPSGPLSGPGPASEPRGVPPAGLLGADFERVMAARRAEADDFYHSLAPVNATDDERAVMRQAFAGMIWCKQFFHYDVARWLDGDPGQPTPPESRRHGRNAAWMHLNNHDVISMPDAWEYPWYAAWDLAFQCVALAHLDPEFAKSQLILLGREWYMHPNGQLPAYEWSFDDVNPPVQAWAALRIYRIDVAARAARGEPDAGDLGFLERIFHKLVLNFTWWVNRKDAQGQNVFEGGFLGLDNIGLFDRSKPLPVMGHLEQSDGTAWMAMYCLNLLEIALTLAVHDPVYEDVATKFFEHFTYIASAMRTQGLWNEQDGFFYDVLNFEDGRTLPIRAISMVGVVSLFAVTRLNGDVLHRLPQFASRMRWFLANRPDYASCVAHIADPLAGDARLLSVVGPEQMRRILSRVLSEAELLSPYGLRSLSCRHRDQPLTIDLPGLMSTLDYEPAESTNYLFGGNSNWRGPIWFPLNYLLIEALGRFHASLGDDFTVEFPTGSGHEMTLAQVADDLARRLVNLFLPGPDGRRPVLGEQQLFQENPLWRGLIPFHEYFHGDNGKGLGASHQTGWTGLVADLIADRRLGGRR
ncbi:MAG: glucosidase [Actinomycetota bacterium]|nr:glucosidase [Actinomycetota bacterium]MDQ6947955.1 glucosidase [Actinomycetota bacterium]